MMTTFLGLDDLINYRKHLNLATASFIVQEFLDSDYLKTLGKDKALKLKKENEIALLFQIKNALGVMQSLQRNWKKHNTLVSNFWSLKAPNGERTAGFTQDELLSESKKIEEKTLAFTEITLEKLIRDIETGPYRDLSSLPFYNAGFTTLKTCLEHTLAQLNETKKVFDKYYSKSSNAAESLAIALGARYIPYSQSLDPIQGVNDEINQDGKQTLEFKGACRGYVMSWRDEIVEQGKYLIMPRLDQPTLLHQLAPLPQYKTVFNCKNFLLTGVWSTVDRMCAQIKKGYIYEITTEGHSMGVRSINGKEIEFFDSNFGLCVFPDIQAFQIWFTRFMRDNYFDLATKEINLTVIGNQPEGSMASIPPLKNQVLQLSPVLESSDNKKMQTMSSNVADLAFNYNGQMNFNSCIRELNLLRSKIERPNFEIDSSKCSLSLMGNGYKLFLCDMLAVKHPNLTPDETDVITAPTQKDQVLQLIDAEIDRLQHSMFASKKVRAFEALKREVNQKGDIKSLNSIIVEWLASEDKESKLTHKKIITEHRLFQRNKDHVSKSYSFIANLTKNFETVPAIIEICQCKVIANLANIMREIKKYPQLQLPSILETYHQNLNGYIKGEISISETLRLLIDQSKNFLADKNNKEHNELSDLLMPVIKILARSDVSSYGSLDSAYLQLLNVGLGFSKKLSTQLQNNNVPSISAMR